MGPKIQKVAATAYVIPTEAPESDGTIEWRDTTLVLVTVHAGDHAGVGYTYADRAAAEITNRVFAPLLVNRDAFALRAAQSLLFRRTRNIGHFGLVNMAISAVDAALWDLKAKAHGVPLHVLLGELHEHVTAYASGGFTSFGERELVNQLQSWQELGFAHVKLKVGTEPTKDPQRVALVREAIGPKVGLMVDANGAYKVPQAIALAQAYAHQGVEWFEEPVSSDELENLHELKQRAPAGMQIAAGEYADSPRYALRMLEASAVHTLQLDATRCLGITGFLDAAAISDAFGVPVSSHCAPSLHVPLGCAVPRFEHLEYFVDHARIEHRFFEGAPTPVRGQLTPDSSRPGLGIEPKWKDLKPYAV